MPIRQISASLAAAGRTTSRLLVPPDGSWVELHHAAGLEGGEILVAGGIGRTPQQPYLAKIRGDHWEAIEPPPSAHPIVRIGVGTDELWALTGLRWEAHVMQVWRKRKAHGWELVPVISPWAGDFTVENLYVFPRAAMGGSDEVWLALGAAREPMVRLPTSQGLLRRVPSSEPPRTDMHLPGNRADTTPEAEGTP